MTFGAFAMTFRERQMISKIRIVFNGQSLTRFAMTFGFAMTIGQNVIANRVETNFQMSSNFRNHLALTKHHRKSPKRHRKTPNVIANQFLKFTNYSHAQMSSQIQTSSQTESNSDHWTRSRFCEYMELPLFFLSTLHFMFMEITCTILASGHKPNCIARTLTTVTTQRHNLGMRDVMFPAPGLESVL